MCESVHPQTRTLLWKHAVKLLHTPCLHTDNVKYTHTIWINLSSFAESHWRSLKIAWEGIEGDRTHICCIPCSQTWGATLVLKNGRQCHLIARKHINLAQAQPSMLPNATNNIDVPAEVAVLGPNALSLPDFTMESANHRKSLGEDEDNPFHNIFMEEDRFFDSGGNPIKFSAGAVPKTRGEMKTLLALKWNELELGNYGFSAGKTWEHESGNCNNATISGIVKEMCALDFDTESSDSDDDPIEPVMQSGLSDNAWKPYESKTVSGYWASTHPTVFNYTSSTDVYVGLVGQLTAAPTFRWSYSIKTFLWVMKQCQMPDIPSFSALYKKQTELTQNMSIKTLNHVFTMGHEFFANRLAETFKLVSISWFWV